MFPTPGSGQGTQKKQGKQAQGMENPSHEAKAQEWGWQDHPAAPGHGSMADLEACSDTHHIWG